MYMVRQNACYVYDEMLQGLLTFGLALLPRQLLLLLLPARVMPIQGLFVKEGRKEGEGKREAHVDNEERKEKKRQIGRRK